MAYADEACQSGALSATIFSLQPIKNRLIHTFAHLLQ